MFALFQQFMSAQLRTSINNNNTHESTRTSSSNNINESTSTSFVNNNATFLTNNTNNASNHRSFNEPNLNNNTSPLQSHHHPSFDDGSVVLPQVSFERGSSSVRNHFGISSIVAVEDTIDHVLDSDDINNEAAPFENADEEDSGYYRPAFRSRNNASQPSVRGNRSDRSTNSNGSFGGVSGRGGRFWRGGYGGHAGRSGSNSSHGGRGVGQRLAGAFRRVPRDLSTHFGGGPLLSKYDRGHDAITQKKTYDKIIIEPPESQKIGYLNIDNALDSSSDMTTLAAEIAAYSSNLQTMAEWHVSYDATPPIMMYSDTDLNDNTPGGTVINLITHHTWVDETSVFMWQEWFNSYSTSEDLQSSQWSATKWIKTFKEPLKSEVIQQHSELPYSQQGVASVIKIGLSKVHANNHESKQLLQQLITSFDITRYPGEDVKLAASHLKEVCKILNIDDDMPPRSAAYILDGMDKSSDSTFNTYCSLVKLNLPTTRLRLPGQAPNNKALDNILRLLDDLAQQYRDACFAKTWPALTKASPSTSSGHLYTVGSPSSTTFQTTSTQLSPEIIHQAAAYIASQQTSGKLPTSPVSNRICYKCGKSGHIAVECEAEEGSRGRSTSYTRGSSRHRRDNSMDSVGSRGYDKKSNGGHSRCHRDATPGHRADRSRSNSQSRNVSWRDRDRSSSRDRRSHSRSNRDNKDHAAFFLSKLQGKV
jgi:hypothetical protein